MQQPSDIQRCLIALLHSCISRSLSLGRLYLALLSMKISTIFLAENAQLSEVFFFGENCDAGNQYHPGIDLCLSNRVLASFSSSFEYSHLEYLLGNDLQFDVLDDLFYHVGIFHRRSVHWTNVPFPILHPNSLHLSSTIRLCHAHHPSILLDCVSDQSLLSNEEVPSGVFGWSMGDHWYSITAIRHNYSPREWFLSYCICSLIRLSLFLVLCASILVVILWGGDYCCLSSVGSTGIQPLHPETCSFIVSPRSTTQWYNPHEYAQ